jgi:hypothetical protein
VPESPAFYPSKCRAARGPSSLYFSLSPRGHSETPSPSFLPQRKAGRCAKHRARVKRTCQGESCGPRGPGEDRRSHLLARIAPPTRRRPGRRGARRSGPGRSHAEIAGRGTFTRPRRERVSEVKVTQTFSHPATKVPRDAAQLLHGDIIKEIPLTMLAGVS